MLERLSLPQRQLESLRLAETNSRKKTAFEPKIESRQRLTKKRTNRKQGPCGPMTKKLKMWLAMSFFHYALSVEQCEYNIFRFLLSRK